MAASPTPPVSAPPASVPGPQPSALSSHTANGPDTPLRLRKWVLRSFSGVMYFFDYRKLSYVFDQNPPGKGRQGSLADWYGLVGSITTPPRYEYVIGSLLVRVFLYEPIHPPFVLTN